MSHEQNGVAQFDLYPTPIKVAISRKGELVLRSEIICLERFVLIRAAIYNNLHCR